MSLPEPNVGYRLSPQQRRLWTLQQSSAIYCAQAAALIEGDLRGALLRRAAQAAIDRHEILRTSFRCIPGLDAPLQVISENREAVVHEVDLSQLLPSRQPEALENCVREEREQEIDVGKESGLRIGLITLTPQRHVLTLRLPAICADTTSMISLFKQIIGDYRAGMSGEKRPVKALQHVQFSEWQNELLEADGEEERQMREFWRQQELKHTRVRLPEESLPVSPGFSEPKTFALEIENNLALRVKELAETLGTTLPTIFLASWQCLLWRLMDEPLIWVMTAFDCRKFEELRETVGPLTKYLPIPCHFAAAYSFSDIVRELHGGCSDARWRQAFYSPHHIHEKTAARNGAGGYPALGFEYAQIPAGESVGATTFTLYHLYCHADHFKLKLRCLQAGDALHLELAYDWTIYRRESVQRLAGELMTLLRSAIDTPEKPVARLEVMTEEERRQLVTEWNTTAIERRQFNSVKEAFEARVRAIPDATAAVSEERQLTYAELNARANRLAHQLRSLGVGPEVVVGICLERSLEMLIGILGVLKAGGAYLPLDPNHPAERRAFISEDAGASVLLTQWNLSPGPSRGSVPVFYLDADSDTFMEQSTEDPQVELDVDHLAYVIYTSGSTGRPKGVMIRQHSVLNLLAALHRTIYAHHHPRLRVSLNAPPVFDASVKQIGQLLAGHTLCIVPEAARLDGAALLDHLKRHQIDVLDCTPSQLRFLLEARLAGEPRASGECPQVVLVGGEAIDAQLWRQMSDEPGTSYYNVYGPTECTVDAAACRVQKEAERPTIGRPLANVETYVLDAHMQLAPAGVAGELHLGGAGLARGYLGRPDLTAESFLAHPFANAEGARLYKTGDHVRRLPGGEFEFLGRRDHQIKMRGYRIELEEIEAVLSEHPSVLESSVLAEDDESGNSRLMAYVVPRRKRGPSLDERNCYTLPNGLIIAHLNRNETEHLYDEIFLKQVYLRHGISLPPDACVFDVGANIGLFTLFVEQQCAEARIYSFEPIRAIFECLQLNSDLYGGDVRTFAYGLSAAEKEESFSYYPGYTTMSGQSRYADVAGDKEVVKRFLSGQHESGMTEAARLLESADQWLAARFDEKREPCRLRRLSDVMKEEGVGHIDLLKVDVQRAEMDVMQGINEDDWMKIEQVVIEVHNGREPEGAGRLREMRRLLENRGFRVVVEQSELLRDTDRWNLYAVADGYVKESRARRARKTRLADPEKKIPPLVIGELRGYLRTRLPEYMLPSAFSILKGLPLTRHGKVDRAALAALKDSLRAESHYVAPQNEIERVIVSIWQEVLRLEKVSVEERFFDAGGNSILTVQVCNRIQEKLGRDLPLIEMFNHPTIKSLAKYLSDKQDADNMFSKIQNRAHLRDQALRWRRQSKSERRSHAQPKDR